MNNQNPKISVITVCYNAVDSIELTIRSVVCQIYPNFEYIIVDGGSKDGTVDIMSRYVNKITKMISEPDCGIYNAMNKGIRLASGDYCIFMNAGDMFCHDLVLRQVSIFLYTNSDVYVGRELSYKKGKLIDYVYPPQREYLRKRLLSSSLSHQSAFIKRTLLIDTPYDENLRLVSDWKFWIQTLWLGEKSYEAMDVDVCKFNHEGATFSNLEKGRSERMQVTLELLGKDFLPKDGKDKIFGRIIGKLKRGEFCTFILHTYGAIIKKTSYQTNYIRVMGANGCVPIMCNMLGCFPMIRQRAYIIKHKSLSQFLNKELATGLVEHTKNLPLQRPLAKKFIWVLWWQGEKNMPFLTRMCLRSIRKNACDYEVKLISKENYQDYVEVPPPILELLGKGRVSITLLSDVLRFLLLSKYGGLWIDSTCIVLKPLSYSKDVSFISPKIVQTTDKHYVSAYRWASYFIGGTPNIAFESMSYLFDQFFKKHNHLLDYLLVDYLLNLTYDTIGGARKIIDDQKENNIHNLELQNILNDEFDIDTPVIVPDSVFYKLNRKTSYQLFTGDGKPTIYHELIRKMI